MKAGRIPGGQRVDSSTGRAPDPLLRAPAKALAHLPEIVLLAVLAIALEMHEILRVQAARLAVRAGRGRVVVLRAREETDGDAIHANAAGVVCGDLPVAGRDGKRVLVAPPAAQIAGKARGDEAVGGERVVAGERAAEERRARFSPGYEHHPTVERSVDVHGAPGQGDIEALAEDDRWFAVHDDVGIHQDAAPAGRAVAQIRLLYAHALVHEERHVEREAAHLVDRQRIGDRRRLVS